MSVGGECPSKETLIEQCKLAIKILGERLYEEDQLIELLAQIHLGAKARSASLQERPHDYWDELAHVIEPLPITLASFAAKKYPDEPTNILKEQINAFVTAAEDAASAAG